MTGAFLIICLTFSCTSYTPKPRGYFRIELPEAMYRTLSADSLPFGFRISTLATVEYPPKDVQEKWINISYPALEAKIYCTYLPATPSSMEALGRESRALVSRQTKGAGRMTQQAYEHPEKKVYALLYESDGASASPIQFTVTDSMANFFRGALLYNRPPDADSLAPVTRYLKDDIMELIQSFYWK